MIQIQHNVVSLLYASKGFIESYFDKEKEGLFENPEQALEQARYVLKRAYRQSHRALQVTKRISKTLKLMESHSASGSYSPLREVWDKVIQLMKKQYPLSPIEIITHIPKECPRILCAENELVEIFYCLVDNAFSAMGDSGRLILRAQLSYSNAQKSEVVITISDTGPGVSEENLKRLFEPFFSTKSELKGNGLGLYMVKTLIKKNQGQIFASSFEGHGATFTLTFPASV